MHIQSYRAAWGDRDVPRVALIQQGKVWGKSPHFPECLPLPVLAEQLWANNYICWSPISSPQGCGQGKRDSGNQSVLNTSKCWENVKVFVLFLRSRESPQVWSEQNNKNKYE